MRWWETRKHILIREKIKIDETFPDNDFAFEVRENQLWLTGTIIGFFEFECKYPPSYPSAPPDIFPKDRSSKHVPKHQYVKEGRFCLDIREKTWCSRLTAADIIKSVATLLIAEGIRKITKEEKLIVYEEPEPTRLDRLLKDKKCVLPSDLSFPKSVNYGRIDYVYHCRSDTYRYIFTDLFEGELKIESSLAKQVWLEDDLKKKYKGLWVRLSIDQYFELFLIEDAKKWIETIRKCSIFPEGFKFEEYFGKGMHWKFILFTDEYPWLPVFFFYNTDKPSISRHGVYFLDIGHLMDRLPSKERYKSLKNKKVTIIGCGSGGSKDAEYLVKSGVGKVVLIDEDILKTENILRHSCQLDDLTVDKVYAVKDKLRKINPFVQVQTMRKFLDVIDAATDELIKDSDLIIVDTGTNEELFNEYAFGRGISAIYSKVYPMGFGGEIIRIIPGLTPCFECSHQYKEIVIEENYMEAKFPELETISYDTLSNGTSVPTPALAADSDFISLICVKMALEILVADDPRSLADSPHIRLWGNKKEWIFNQEFECVNISNDNLKSFRNCIVCYGDSVIEEEIGRTQDQIDSEFAALMSNIKGAAGGDKDSNG